VSAKSEAFVRSGSSLPVLSERAGRKIICLSHDIEEAVDTPISEAACRENLVRMLAIEKTHNVAATYNILGALWQSKVPLIIAEGRHSLGFHSYNHQIEDLRQLPLCRRVNTQVRGYSPPRSRITAEITESNLRRWDFQWLSSSIRSLGFADIRLESGIVKIPVHLDEHPVYAGRLSYGAWKSRVASLLAEGGFVSLKLHDCYAGLWLDDYSDLLAEMSLVGEFWTCDRIAARMCGETGE
jgi:hypothetical protein